MTGLEWWLYITGFAYCLLIETGKEIRDGKSIRKEFPGTLLFSMVWPVTLPIFLVATFAKVIVRRMS